MLETMPEKSSHIPHLKCNIQHFHWIAFVLKYIENRFKWSICCISGHVNCPDINEINAVNCARNKYAIRHLVCNYWNFDWTPFVFKYIENKRKLTFYYIYGAVNCMSMKEINLVPGEKWVCGGCWNLMNWLGLATYHKTPNTKHNLKHC